MSETTIAYRLRHKETQEFATLIRTSNDGSDFCNEFTVSIGLNYIDVYQTENIMEAIRTLSTTIGWYNSSDERPMWEYSGDFSKDFEIVKVEVTTVESNTDIEPFMIVTGPDDDEDYAERYAIDVDDLDIDALDIDYTLADNIDCPDRIDYNDKKGFVIQLDSEHFSKYEGKCIFLGNGEYDAYYVLAVRSGEFVNERLLMAFGDSYTIMFLCRMKMY